MKISCIYGIISKATCNLYIGSSCDFSYRKKAHLNFLNKNKHYNKFLQNHFNKYGISDLLFYIIEKVPERGKLIEREQYYLDTLKPKFNICKIADRRTGILLTQEHKDKISKAHKGRVVSEFIFKYAS